MLLIDEDEFAHRTKPGDFWVDGSDEGVEPVKR